MLFCASGGWSVFEPRFADEFIIIAFSSASFSFVIFESSPSLGNASCL